MKVELDLVRVEDELGEPQFNGGEFCGVNENYYECVDPQIKYRVVEVRVGDVLLGEPVLGLVGTGVVGLGPDEIITEVKLAQEVGKV